MGTHESVSRLRSYISSKLSKSILIVLALFLVVVAQVFSTNPVSAYGADGIVKITVKIAPADSAPGIVVKVKRGTTSRVGDTEVTLSRQNADTFVGDMKVMNADCSSGTQAERNFNATVYNNSGGGPTGSVMQTIGTSSTSQICGNPSSFNFNVTIQPVTPSTTKGSICGNLSYWDPVAKKAMPYQTNNSNIIAVQEGTGTKTAMVKTDDSGHYCIGNVTPGKYKLTASYVKGTTNMDTWNSGVFDVTAGQTTDMSHAATDPSNPPPGGTEPGADEETCAIDGVGWIVCPVASFLSKVTDGAYTQAEKLLVFNVASDPWSTDPAVNPIFTIWSNIRNIANIVFVIAFFIVIFSQATSVGISAYGIRKMLPRIIAAAILVNLSYYICVFAVDVSNIIGAGLDGLIKTVPLTNLQGSNDGGWEKIMSGVMMGAAGAIVVGAAAVYATGTVLAFLVFSLLAIITALAIFLARHVMLIMLIILSPLAFAAYILPNTENLFDKWRKAFIAMLVMYPLIAILFAGTKVASDIMFATAEQTGGDSAWFYKLLALAVLAIPLFGIPWIVKFSGGFIGRIAGMVNNKNRGLIDRARNAGNAGAKVRRSEAGSRIQSGVRKAGAPLTNTWGYDENGKKKKGLGNRFSRGVGGLANAPSRTGFGKNERDSRLGQVQNRLNADYSSSLAGTVDKDDYLNPDGTLNEEAYSAASRRQNAIGVMNASRAAGIGGSVAATGIRAKALAAERDASSKRVAEHLSTYSLHPDGADMSQGGFLESELRSAIAGGDSEKAQGVMKRFNNLGEGGRANLRRIMTGTSVDKDGNVRTDPKSALEVKSAKMRQELTTAILEDNYDSFMKDAADMVKGTSGFDEKSGTWQLGNLQGVDAHTMAQQSVDTMRIQQSRGGINTQEAQRIAGSEQLQTEFKKAPSLKIIQEVASSSGASSPPTATQSVTVSSPPSSVPSVSSGTATRAYSVDDLSTQEAPAIRMLINNAGGIQNLDNDDLEKIRLATESNYAGRSSTGELRDIQREVLAEDEKRYQASQTTSARRATAPQGSPSSASSQPSAQPTWVDIGQQAASAQQSPSMPPPISPEPPKPSRRASSPQGAPGTFDQPSGSSPDYLGRMTPHKADGTPMSHDEADEYHDGLGGN